MRNGFQLKDERLGYALLRVVLGVNLLMHGVGRILMGAGEFAFKLQTQFAHSPLPSWSVRSFGVVLPGIECLLGALILVGLRTRAALIATGALMALLTFGSGLIQDFTAAGTQLIYAAIIAEWIFRPGMEVDAAVTPSEAHGDHHCREEEGERSEDPHDDRAEYLVLK
jgi:thiosulfate dehydrogenase [quinone] large subunit